MTNKDMFDAISDYCELAGDLVEGTEDQCQTVCLIKQECDDCGGSFLDEPDILKKAYRKIHDEKVHHPDHYNSGMECIEEMLLVFGEEVVAHFCLCNAWKYRYRAVDKNGKEDIEKSHWYMKKYKELVECQKQRDSMIMLP